MTFTVFIFFHLDFNSKIKNTQAEVAEEEVARGMKGLL
jgi:hypothetical protein